MDFWIIIVLALAAMIGSRVMIKAVKKRQDKQEDYATLAQHFGWRYERDTTTNRRAIYDIFSDPEDDWTLKIIFITSEGARGSSTRRIEWHTPNGALADGEAVLGMPLPEKTVSMLQNGGTIGSSLTKAALKGTLYAMGRTKFSLEFDKATAGDPGGIVMSTPGQEQAMDTLRRNVTLTEFRGTNKEIDVPIIIRNEDGLTLRRPNVTSDGDELKALVELGKDLRDDL